LKDNSSILEKQEKVFLVNPNLGHPKLINIDSDLKTEIFQTSLLFISNIDESKEFKSSLKKRIKFVPILEYKWKLKSLLEKKKKEKIKKIQKDKNETLKSLDVKKSRNLEAQLKKLKPRAFRGIPIAPKILSISDAPINSIDKLTYIDNEYCSPHDYLLKNKVFKGLTKFYKVVLEFRLTKEILEFLKKNRNFVMLDIVYRTKNKEKQINYHSLVISKQDWSNFKFAHATDLHLAERNDQMYGIIRNWIKIIRRKNFKFLDEKQKEYISELQKRKISKTKKTFLEIDLSFRKRLINPNNQYRKFIMEMNKKVLQNKIDFVVITGDIVDFTILSRLPKELQKIFDYKYSNWQVFKNITLNSNQYKRKGVMRGEELLCPIFTVTGNHDFRPYAYNLKYFYMYRKMGLKLAEALALNDIYSAVPISSIIKSNLALKAYWREINPSLDFSLKLGKNLLIFLNSGSDSYKNIRNFVSGHPSVTGVTDKQIKYLENLINSKIDDGDNVFLSLHGPPVNPKEKRGIFKRLEKKLGKQILTKLEEFKESILKLSKKKLSSVRIDGKFDVKFGAVSSNWEKLIKFCKDFTTLTLSGHTHDLKEFRLADPPDNEKTKIYNAPPFFLKKLENPAAIFYDDYSEILKGPKLIEKYKPFIVQTPALGLKGFKKVSQVGVYRLIRIRKGKLASFKIQYLGSVFD